MGTFPPPCPVETPPFILLAEKKMSSLFTKYLSIAEGNSSDVSELLVDHASLCLDLRPEVVKVSLLEAGVADGDTAVHDP
jgi:hypothetical protein